MIAPFQIATIVNPAAENPARVFLFDLITVDRIIEEIGRIAEQIERVARKKSLMSSVFA